MRRSSRTLLARACRLASIPSSTNAAAPLIALSSQVNSSFPTYVVKTAWGPRHASSVASGSDLAQLVLKAEDADDLSALTPAVENLEAVALPSVLRAAVVRKVADKAFHDALSAATINGLPDMTPADLCTVVQALADLGAIKVFEQLADNILARLQDFNGDMLGAALHAFGTVNYFDADLMEAVVEDIAANPEKYSADNVADVVYAFSKCGFCAPQLVEVVERAGEVLLKEADHDSGEAIVNIVDAYSRVGCSNLDVVDELISKVVTSPEKMPGAALAKLTTAMIRLGYEDSDDIQPLLDALVPKVESLPPSAIVKLTLALGELGLTHQQLMDRFCDDVIPSRYSEFHSAGLSKLVEGLNKLGYYNSQFMKLIKK